LASVKALNAKYEMFVLKNGKHIRTMGAVQFQTWAKSKITKAAEAKKAAPAEAKKGE
jgi:hypothetical protein